jgi:hypothetical protein
LRRGVSTETWVNWPAGWQLQDESVVASFPEWVKYVSPPEIAALRESGFDFVRFTIDTALFFANEKKVTQRQWLLARIDSMITMFRKAGLKVVVDLHSIERGDGSPDSLLHVSSPREFERYLEFVTEVGRIVNKHDPDWVAFEPMNEVPLDCMTEAGASQWSVLLRMLHATAREAAPKATLVLQGACRGRPAGLVKLNPAQIADENTIWSFHTFAPEIFTHQGAIWTPGPEAFVSRVTFPADERAGKSLLDVAVGRIARSDATPERKAQLKSMVERDLGSYVSPDGAMGELERAVDAVEAWRSANAIGSERILVGEFGVIREGILESVPQRVRAQYLSAARKLFESKGWGWCVWSWGGSFGVVESDYNRTPVAEIITGLGLKPVK